MARPAALSSVPAEPGEGIVEVKTSSDVAADTEADESRVDQENDDSGETDAKTGEVEPPARWRRSARRNRKNRAAPGFAAVVLALVLAAAGYEGYVVYRHHRTTVAAAQALDAANAFMLALTSIDPNAVDKSSTEVLNGSTGEFNDMYSHASEQLRTLLIENQATAHGTVIEAAVKSASTGRAEIMLFVDQSVRNAAAPKPQLDRSRVVVTMDKVDGRWLASKIEMP